MGLTSIEDLLYLSYVTNYNISEIAKAQEYETMDNYISDYQAFQRDKNIIVTENDLRKAEGEMKNTIEKCRYFGIKIIPFSSHLYPRALNDLKDKPPLLFTKGKLPSQKMIAVVGSRSASPVASEKINQIIEVAAANDYATISGLALGIDTLAHSFSIKNNVSTVAVMPNSLDNIYPFENWKLANDILDKNGALVSELPIGINRGKQSFVQRNRIQSALSEIVIPVEMGTNSGTMHTVNFALRQSRKLIIPHPSMQDQKRYSKYYEGIMFMIDNQYASKKNVFYYSNLEELKYLLKNDGSVTQASFPF